MSEKDILKNNIVYDLLINNNLKPNYDWDTM